MLRQSFSLLLACASALLLSASPAFASSFDISPISVAISPKTPSAMLTVTNRGSEALRFHVAAYAWDESPTGEMLLKPTSDVVFFPAMLVLNAGEARKLRVGMNVPPGPVEKSYRIFVQELPPLAKKGDEGNGVRMLTKMGVPVFIEGAPGKPVPKVVGLQLEGSTLTLGVANAGNAHFRADKIVVKAMDGAKVVDTQELKGWYVLPGRTRQYTVNLPKAACGALKSVDVEVVLTDSVVKGSLASAHCTP